MLSHSPTCDAYQAPPSRAMTRCECAGVTFQEIATRMEAERTTLDEICRRTQCGNTCTACLPDLARFIATRNR